LILDIFARRAQTRQSKLQVELAQLRYQLPRLKGAWTHLERQGGAIGSRGPGETQLETDRRLAETRISLLKEELDEVRQQKVVEGWGRKEFEMGAIVGYTNVGKSALLNALSAPTGKGVLVKNQLFATLGASTRRVELGGGRDVLLSDTVGFVRRLPHQVVEAFHSTLAEVENADFLLHVISAADEERDDKLRAVERVLTELKATAPMILVVNQIDRISDEERETLRAHFPDAVFTSALTWEGLDSLRERIFALMDAEAEEIELTLDGRDENLGRVLSELARHGRVLSQEWQSEPHDGVAPKLHVRAKLARRWRDSISVPRRAWYDGTIVTHG
jgi:GTP-binding protein HflX